MTPGAIVSVLIYPDTTSPTRRMATVVSLPRRGWVVVRWADGTEEYVTRKRVRVEGEP